MTKEQITTMAAALKSAGAEIEALAGERNLQLTANQLAAMDSAIKGDFINWLLNHVEIEHGSQVHSDINVWLVARDLPEC
jgi:hypothetical protein